MNGWTEEEEKEYIIASGNFVNLINGWILSSITETYNATRNFQNNSTPFVAFILISTTIDFLAGFLAGITDLDNPGNAGRVYKDFVTRYMPSYPPELLYKDLRCRLAHNFTVGEAAVLTHDRRDMHGKLVPKINKVVINFENFYEDFENAIKGYIDDLSTSDDLKEKFMTRYKLGIPQSFQIRGVI